MYRTAEAIELGSVPRKKYRGKRTRMHAQSKRDERGIMTNASPHSGAAEWAGLTMQEAELLIFGTDVPH